MKFPPNWWWSLFGNGAVIVTFALAGLVKLAILLTVLVCCSCAVELVAFRRRG